ncbi:MAG: (Fe-S)-binding protein [Phycisphaeraceae bacterium]|nr:MAG: (Fe-S)-binding protein [Phycisphaeraceae bacterium]
MRVSLMVPCFIDQYFPRVGISVVELLERLGHEVAYPMEFACCGQPAFNTGCWPEARVVARRVLDLYESAEAVVAPSGSCAAMAKRFYPELFKGEGELARAEALAAKTWEFSSFLVDHLGVTEVGAKLAGRATFHDGCHGLRELGIADQPRRLLAEVEGLELVEMDERETCCGFGGTFAAKFQEVSVAMAQVKAASVARTEADYVISNDSSCLMHLQAYFDRQRIPTKCLHLAEVLVSR